jgi:hypothetical protein
VLLFQRLLLLFRFFLVRLCRSSALAAHWSALVCFCTFFFLVLGSSLYVLGSHFLWKSSFAALWGSTEHNAHVIGMSLAPCFLRGTPVLENSLLGLHEHQSKAFGYSALEVPCRPLISCNNLPFLDGPTAFCLLQPEREILRNRFILIVRRINMFQLPKKIPLNFPSTSENWQNVFSPNDGKEIACVQYANSLDIKNLLQLNAHYQEKMKKLKASTPSVKNKIINFFYIKI